MWDGAGGASRAGWERPGAPAGGGTAARATSPRVLPSLSAALPEFAALQDGISDHQRGASSGVVGRGSVRFMPRAV
jgi:hypothetical protein